MTRLSRSVIVDGIPENGVTVVRRSVRSLTGAPLDGLCTASEETEMLSARERQVLCEIEQRLSSEDPGLAALLVGDMSPRPPRLTRCAHDVTVVVAALLATLCTALSAPGAGLVAALFACSVFAIRRAQFRTPGSHRRWLPHAGGA
jgi:hypothetical protein